MTQPHAAKGKLSRRTADDAARSDALFESIGCRRGKDLRLLPRDELKTALSARHRANLIVAARIEKKSASVVFCTGDLKRLPVPFAWFESIGFRDRNVCADMSICDYGQTIAIGKKEIATDRVLEEFDATFAERDRANRLRARAR